MTLSPLASSRVPSLVASGSTRQAAAGVSITLGVTNMTAPTDAPRPIEVLAWNMPSRSQKFHLFIAGRSLCMKWGFMDGNPDQPWKGGPKGARDCAECHKRATKHHPIKEEPKP